MHLLALCVAELVFVEIQFSYLSRAESGNWCQCIVLHDTCAIPWSFCIAHKYRWLFVHNCPYESVRFWVARTLVEHNVSFDIDKHVAMIPATSAETLEGSFVPNYSMLFRLSQTFPADARVQCFLCTMCINRSPTTNNKTFRLILYWVYIVMNCTNSTYITNSAVISNLNRFLAMVTSASEYVTFLMMKSV